MATYVNDLRLKEIATGDESGTWGTSSNTNLELISNSMGYGSEAVANASTHTITMADGAADEFRCTFLRLTGGGQACTVTLAPNTLSHTWIIRNTTSYALTFTQGSGANVIIAAGLAKMVTTDGAGSGAVVYECLEDLELGGTLTVGVDDTGQDVKFFGATSGRYWLWDESADGVVQQGTLTVGVDDTGYDVKFFGATSGSYMLWDESHNDLKLFGSTSLFVAGNADLDGDLDVDGTTNLDVVDIDGAVQIDGTVTVGVDDTGLDVKFFGATSGAYMLWDESADDLKLVGAAGFTVAGDIDVDGTSNLDIVDVDGAVNFAADVTYADGADIITASAGTSNFRAGVNAGNSIASGGNYNVCVGDEAGTALTTGDSNVAVGYIALDACTTSSNNVAVGKSALTLCTTGASNTAVGSSALAAHIDSNYCTAVGADSLQNNTTGSSNTAVGQGALNANSTGTTNTAVGYRALIANTTADNNVAVGVSALTANTTGTNNVAVGANSLDANVESSNNTAIGDNALGKNSSGASNVAVGAATLTEMVDANYSTAIGADALQNATGGLNTACGQGAGNTITTGTSNVCVGYTTNISAVGGVNQIVMGAAITGGANNQFTFGKASNIVQNEFDTDAAWTRTSDVRKKRNIKDDTLGLDFINDLRPITHQWKPSNEFPQEWQEYSEKNNMDLDAVMHGFIAQEVKEALDKAGVDTFSGWKERTDGSQVIAREMFIMPLINAVKELSAKVKELESKSHNKCSK
jgi:hypothetical protein